MKNNDTRYIILCDGKSKRWIANDYVTKHMVDVYGEPLLHRTVRQLKQYTNNIFIVSHNPDYTIDGTTRYEAENRQYEIDRFCGCYPIWTDKTVFLYGDVFYTDETIKTIVESKTNFISYFGRLKGSKLTMKDHAELFAVKVFNKETFKNICFQIRSLIETNKIKNRGLGWDTYMYLLGGPACLDIYKLRDFLAGPIHKPYFTEINDRTDDFDYVEDYYNWLISDPNLKNREYLSHFFNGFFEWLYLRKTDEKIKNFK